MPFRPRKRDQQYQLAKFKAGHYPNWDDFLSEDDFENLASKCLAKSRQKNDQLWQYLSGLITRDIWARESEAKTTLNGRRQKLDAIFQQTKKLRQSLLELNDVARFDLMIAAGPYSGNNSSIDHSKADEWLTDAGGRNRGAIVRVSGSRRYR